MAKQPVRNNTLDYAEKIQGAWQQASRSILEVAELLCDAEDNLLEYEWEDLVEELPFSGTTTEKLIAIGRSSQLVDTDNQKYLPPHWTSLYELSLLSEEAFKNGVDEGLIYSGAIREDITEYRKRYDTNSESASKATKARSQERIETARVATLSVKRGFDLDRLPALQSDIEALDKKYGVVIDLDRSKSGVLSLSREALVDECNKWLAKNKKKFNKGVSEDEVREIESAMGQLKRNSKRQPKEDYPEGHRLSIHNANHKFHGWNWKQITDHVRDQNILTKYLGLKELDKEAYCFELLLQHATGNARLRTDAKRKLTSLANRGGEDAKAFAASALDRLIEL
jgi:hypothetical protein